MLHDQEDLWDGVYPAITTQFDSKSELNLDAYAKNLGSQLEAGIDGVVLAGSLGEASTLDVSDKERLLKETLKIVDNKIPIIVNIAEQSTKGAIRSVELAEHGGADGLMLLPPMRYHATSNETVQFFKDVAQSTSLPIMLYNNPVDYKIEITIDMLDRLIDIGNIQAIKESTRDVTNVTRINNEFGDRIKVLCGVDTIIVESLAMGATGWVAGLCNAFPKESVALFNHTVTDNIDRALAILMWFLPLLELDLSPRLVQNIKYCEFLMGMGTGHVRKPRLPLSNSDKKAIENMVKVFKSNTEYYWL